MSIKRRPYFRTYSKKIFVEQLRCIFLLKRGSRTKILKPRCHILLGLGYKSSRILGLEEAFIPELRKIEPIPGMSEANLERLQRRQQVTIQQIRFYNCNFY